VNHGRIGGSRKGRLHAPASIVAIQDDWALTVVTNFQVRDRGIAQGDRRRLVRRRRMSRIEIKQGGQTGDDRQQEG